MQINDMLGARLASVHNLRFYMRLLEELRDAIRAGGFERLRAKIHETPTR